MSLEELARCNTKIKGKFVIKNNSGDINIGTCSLLLQNLVVFTGQLTNEPSYGQF